MNSHDPLKDFVRSQIEGLETSLEEARQIKRIRFNALIADGGTEISAGMDAFICYINVYIDALEELIPNLASFKDYLSRHACICPHCKHEFIKPHDLADYDPCSPDDDHGYED